MKTRDGIVSAIIILLVIIFIVISSILIINGKKDKASDNISDQMKAYYINETEPEGSTFYSNNANSIPLPTSDKT